METRSPNAVIPAQAGIQEVQSGLHFWTPACAGVTMCFASACTIEEA
jgi:hypothetical protein